MMQTDQEKIAYVLKEIGNMERIVAGKTADDLENNLMLERAVSMTLQIISDKIGSISDTFQKHHP